MTTKLSLIFLYSLIILTSCFSAQDCPEGINLLPMYGRQIKCDEQLKSDREFLLESDKKFKDRKKAAIFYVDKGWEYFHKNDLETAMKRFNQAWLLDSLNADTYWGFGSTLGTNHQFSESVPLFERSIELNASNSKVHEAIATSFGQLFFESKDRNMLNQSINSFKKAIKLDSKNAIVLGQLAGAYSYLMQKDSARKYMSLADQIDPKAVNPEVRKILKGK